MDSSVYITLSRQVAQYQNMEIAANNIANVNTPGYSAQKLMFSQYLVDNEGLGKQDAYADTPFAYRDTSGGAIQNTGNPLDLAIKGDAYFQIETPLGVRYTKAGAFQIDAQGVVVNTDGYPVLGADGAQISLPIDAKNIVINGLGQITADGNAVGQVGVVEFEDSQKLTRFGSTMYGSEEAGVPSLSARVLQGALESSNVSGTAELVRVMELSRSFGSSSKFIETVYDLERKTSATFTRSKTA